MLHDTVQVFLLFSGFSCQIYLVTLQKDNVDGRARHTPLVVSQSCRYLPFSRWLSFTNCPEGENWSQLNSAGFLFFGKYILDLWN